jgi:hypothetical protein
MPFQIKLKKGWHTLVSQNNENTKRGGYDLSGPSVYVCNSNNT